MTELYVCNVNESDHDIDIDALAQRLSAYRRKRISSCRVAHDRLLSAAAGYLLALALSRHGFVESALHYAVGEHGKPYFTDVPCTSMCPIPANSPYVRCLMSASAWMCRSSFPAACT